MSSWFNWGTNTTPNNTNNVSNSNSIKDKELIQTSVLDSSNKLNNNASASTLKTPTKIKTISDDRMIVYILYFYSIF